MISENRFIAARDGIDAELIDGDAEARVPLDELLGHLMPRCREHAEELGCERELAWVKRLAARSGAKRQLERAEESSVPRLVAQLADEFQVPPLG